MRFFSVALLIFVGGSLAFAGDWAYDSNNDRAPNGANLAAAQGAPLTVEVVALEVAALEYAQLAAWNKHDLESYLAWYWRSPELIDLTNGEQLIGYDALATQMRTAFGTNPSSMGHTEMGRLRIKMVGKDAAIMVASFVTTTSAHSDAIEDTTFVKRFPEGWKIVFETATIHAQ
jgi:hypothetical protein